MTIRSRIALAERAKEGTDMDSVTVTLKAEVMAMKFVMLSLIDALPEALSLPAPTRPTPSGLP